MDRDKDYGHGASGHDGGHKRMMGRRPVTDYGSSMVQWMRNRRPRYKVGVVVEAERPSPSFIVDMLPPAARTNPADTIPAKFLHSSKNKAPSPINVVRWTPEGRRCLTGSASGEFTLWNGMGFNFETIMQVHDFAVRAMVYSHSEDWLVTADHGGNVKYHQPNFNTVTDIQNAHNDYPIRDLAFSPNDSKFVTASDDHTLKIFDFATAKPDSTLSGHNWDAKSVDWHPTKGLLVSGSKDHQVKLWDPRTQRCLTTLHGHKNTISKTVFEPSRGQLLATSARDQTARVFDLRMMRDVCLLRGNEKDITTLTWHPFIPSLLSTGASDGCIAHYLLDEANCPAGTNSSVSPYDSSDPSNTPAQNIFPAHKIQHAHDNLSVWSLHWHPIGHILASGSSDKTTRFWTRPRPGESHCFEDESHIGKTAAEARGTWIRGAGRREVYDDDEQEIEDEANGLVDQKMPAKQPILPGIPGLSIRPTGPDGNSGGALSNGQLVVGPSSNLPFGENIVGKTPSEIATLIAEGKLHIPPPPVGGQAQGILPPPPNFDFSKLPPGLFPNFPLPPGLSPIPAPSSDRAGLPGIGSDSGGGGSIRKRAPLPSQQESLLEEQRKGKYRVAR